MPAGREQARARPPGHGPEDQAFAEKAKVEAYKARKIRARHEAQMVVAEACETPEDAEAVMEEVEERLDAYLADPAFAGEDLAPLVRALCEDLGFEFKEESEAEDAQEAPAASDAPEASEPAEAEAPDAPAPEFDAAPRPAPGDLPPPEPPRPGPRMIQTPDFGWYPDPDSS